MKTQAMTMNLMPLLRAIVAAGRPCDRVDVSLLIALYQQTLQSNRPFTVDNVKEVLQASWPTHPTR